MQQIKHRNADTTGLLLGTVIVALAVLDLLIWAALWNVPNPISKWLAPLPVTSRSSSPVWTAGTEAQAQPAMLTDCALGALPRSLRQ